MNEALQKWRSGESTEALEILSQLTQEDNRSLVARRNNRLLIGWDASDSISTRTTLDTLKESYETFTHCEEEVSSEQEWKVKKLKKDAIVFVYNQAVIKFRQRLYFEAETLLRSIYTDVELRQDALMFCVPFLLFEICFINGAMTECAQLMSFIEQKLTSVAPPSYAVSTELWNWTEEVNQKLLDAPAGSSSRESGVSTIPAFQLKTDQLKFPDISRIGRSNVDCVSSEQEQESVHLSDLKLRAKFSGAKTMLLMNRFRDVHRVINELQQQFDGSLPIEAVFLKAQTYLAQKKTHQALELLFQCHQQLSNEDQKFKNQVLNNIGVIYIQLRKLNLASMCFMTLIRSLRNDNTTKTEGVKENCLLSLYNVGIISLHNGRYQEALKKFTEASRLLYMKPYIWIRMAECCIALSKEHIEEDLAIKKIPGKEGISPSIYILPGTNQSSSIHESSPGSNLLLTAYSYLQNALALVSTESSDRMILEGMIYLKLAYTTLSLNQPERCLYYTKKLKALEGLDEMMTFFRVLYEVEALCLLDNSREAIRVLKDSVESMNHRDWSNGDLQWIMLHNLAAVYCMRRDLEDGKVLAVEALKVKPNAQESILLLLYIELVRGNRMEALDIIKSYSSS